MEKHDSPRKFRLAGELRLTGGSSALNIAHLIA
jgi:hypothetical protein